MEKERASGHEKPRLKEVGAVTVDAPSRGIPLGDVIKVPLPPERPGSPERVLALMGQHAAEFGKIKKLLKIPSGKSPACTRGSGKAKPICLVSPAVRCEREGCPISATVARWCGFPLPTPALKAEAASATPLFVRFQGWDTQEAAHGESHGHQHTTQR